MFKLEKSIRIMGCKSILSVKSQSRLVGGADVPEKVEEPLNPTTEATKEVIFTTVEETKDTLKTANEISTISDGPCYFFSAQVSGSTGDKKVDEMIDYVQQNLQEASKALVTLSENFEQDSKVESCKRVEPS